MPIRATLSEDLLPCCRPYFEKFDYHSLARRVACELVRAHGLAFMISFNHDHEFEPEDVREIELCLESYEFVSLLRTVGIGWLDVAIVRQDALSINMYIKAIEHLHEHVCFIVQKRHVIKSSTLTVSDDIMEATGLPNDETTDFSHVSSMLLQRLDSNPRSPAVDTETKEPMAKRHKHSKKPKYQKHLDFMIYLKETGLFDAFSPTGVKFMKIMAYYQRLVSEIETWPEKCENMVALMSDGGGTATLLHTFVPAHDGLATMTMSRTLWDLPLTAPSKGYGTHYVLTQRNSDACPDDAMKPVYELLSEPTSFRFDKNTFTEHSPVGHSNWDTWIWYTNERRVVSQLLNQGNVFKHVNDVTSIVLAYSRPGWLIPPLF